jgi:hypothetical protein
MIQSSFAGATFTVARETRKDGTMTGLWQWKVFSPSTGKAAFNGTEASKAAALNAAQEQCGIAPGRRKTDYTAVAF